MPIASRYEIKSTASPGYRVLFDLSGRIFRVDATRDKKRIICVSEYVSPLPSIDVVLADHRVTNLVRHVFDAPIMVSLHHKRQIPQFVGPLLFGIAEADGRVAFEIGEYRDESLGANFYGFSATYHAERKTPWWWQRLTDWEADLREPNPFYKAIPP